MPRGSRVPTDDGLLMPAVALSGSQDISGRRASFGLFSCGVPMRLSNNSLCRGALGLLGLALTSVSGVVEPATVPTARPQAIADPFTYCTKVGTDDRVGLPTGEQAAVLLEPYTRTALGLPPNAPLAASSIFWRCMDTKVYVCTVGANLPCASRANQAKQTRGAQSFCREHPDATDVPAYAVGHVSLYVWRCAAGQTVRGSAVATLDRRGFRTDIWHELSK
jgi:hypothetical protein